MTLVELRYIVALATEGNFSRAAERCAVSQPTLSVAIARIEQELGVQLFERAKGFVSATPVGADIVRQARVTLHEAEKIRDIARTGRDQLAGPLRLGVIHTVGPYLLPQLIVELRRIAPAMALVIEENMTAALQDMLTRNDIDVAVIALPFEPAGVVTRALYDESFHVIVPRGHPWSDRDAINPDEVSGDDVLLLKAGNCFRDQVLGACPQVSKAETDIHLGYSIGTLRWMVASGLGVSILPASALQKQHVDDLIRVIPFAPPEPARRIALAFRAGFARPKAIEALVAAVAAIDTPAFRPVARD